MKKVKSILKKLFVVGALALSLIGCKDETKNAESAQSGTVTEVKKTVTAPLVVAQGAEAKSLDPHGTNDQPSSRIMVQIYDRLVEQDDNMNIQPSLAERVEQRTPTETVFYLRKGVKFHNGEELKASDVKFTFDRMKHSSMVKHIIGAIKEVNVEDDYTVVIVTDAPFGPLLSHLSHTAASILNEKAVKEAGPNYAQSPVGTGAFIFDKWIIGESIVLKGNKDYFKGAPELETVVFKPIPEDSSRFIGLETGEIDISYDLNPMDKGNLVNKKGLVLMEEPSLSTAYIGLNTKKELFSDKRVRQAIAYALDTKGIIDAVWKGAAKEADAPIGPLVFGYSPGKKYERNIAKAKELLKEAGYDDGISFTIWVNDNPIRRDIAVIAQDQLREAGINIKVEVLEWGAYLDKTAKGESEAFILGWVSVTGDADYGLYPLFHTNSFGGAGNRAFYSNPDVDNLLDAGRTEINPEKRKEIYKEAIGIIQGDLPIITLAYTNHNAGLNERVKNFKLSPAGHHKLYRVTKEIK